MRYPQVVVRKGEKSSWSLTIDGVPVPYVTEVRSSRTASGFPQVTITMVGELYQEDEPVNPWVTLTGSELWLWAKGLQ